MPSFSFFFRYSMDIPSNDSMTRRGKMMRTRFLRGDSAQNNGLTLPAGEFSYDTEKKALRLHDGSTLGGFEMVGVQAYVPAGHGPNDLVGGDDQWGFYGEVLSSDFISGDALASAIGLSAGTGQFSNTEWLKFNSGGNIVMIPKKPIRYSVSWEDIYQVGAVYGDDTVGSNPSGGNRLQDTVVTIDGFDYRVTLMRGASTDPVAGDPVGYDISESDGSEWNRLMYPIHSGVHTNSNNPNPHTDPDAASFGSWASYSDSDLVIASGNGRYQWMQESTDNYRVHRGLNGVTGFNRTTATFTNTNRGWRPRLELVV